MKLHQFVFALLCLAGVPGYAQQLTARMVAIKPREGQDVQFERGYKRHLEWHRANKDTWRWYGWSVISGERQGYFIDGSFGHAWSDFDAPVAPPAGDRADNELNVGPFAHFLSVASYVLLPELSSSSALEAGSPTPLLHTRYYRRYPGKDADFERALLNMHRAYAKSAHPRAYTWYKLADGGEHPAYLLMLPLMHWEDMQGIDQQFGTMDGVREVRSEMLRYRADMSYLPPR